MSTISFPHGGPSSSVHSLNDSHFSFDGGASFTMNPLSSHPPRTPKHSSAAGPVVTGNSVYGHNLYDAKEEKPLEQEEVDDEHNEEIEEPSAATPISREDIWREMVKTRFLAISSPLCCDSRLRVRFSYLVVTSISVICGPFH